MNKCKRYNGDEAKMFSISNAQLAKLQQQARFNICLLLLYNGYQNIEKQ